MTKLRSSFGLPLLARGEIWYPQKDKRVAPCQILTVLSNLIKYRTVADGRTLPLVRSISPSAFRSWVKKWDARI